MLRIVVSEEGQEALPAVDVDDAHLVIGSGPAAGLRIPAQVARAEHVRIEGARWTALAPVTVDGRACTAGDAGAIADGVTFSLGSYRVFVAPAPAGIEASPPARTESLARELVRSLLGSGAAPSFEIARGPGAGGTRVLPPPEATLVIGRGDEATWVVLDGDLSRTHAEIRRGWDGVTIRDLGSKNGTRVGGALVEEATLLHDGVEIELANVTLVFRDPAERHLRGAGATKAATPLAVRAAARPSPPPPPPSPLAPSMWPLVIAGTIAAIAVAGLVWVLAG